MRPKATFKRKDQHPSARGGWTSDYAKESDKTIEQGLAAILQTFRTRYYTAADAPKRQDVLATLRALGKIPDAQAFLSIDRADGTTIAQLDQAALNTYKRTHPKLAQAPVEIFDQRKWTPEHIRILASAALESFDMSSVGGRPITREIDISLAAVIVDYWRRTQKTKPTLSRYRCTPFHAFAMDAFTRAGRSVSEETIYPLLLAARKRLQKKG